MIFLLHQSFAFVLFYLFTLFINPLYCPYFYPAEKEIQVRSDDFGRDLSSVMTLLTKQETFDAGLTAFDKEGIQAITALKDQLVAAEHEQTEAILKRYADVKAR